MLSISLTTVQIGLLPRISSPDIVPILWNRISEIPAHMRQKALAASQPASYPRKWLKADTQINWFTLIYFTQIPFIS